MKLDISGIKKTHAFLLPQNEPNIAQNNQRRAQSRALLAAYEGKVKEQTRFELALGANTGRLDDILKPRVMAPTLPGPGGIGKIPEREYVLEQANTYAGKKWPTETPWGEAFRSGISSTSVLDVDNYKNLFAHLGMIPEFYMKSWDQISVLDNYILDNNKVSSNLFTSHAKKAEKQITINLAIDEARTSYAYHFNKTNDDLRVYMHMDFIYVDQVSTAHKVRFVFPENEEQKAIWRNVFWGESLPSFPIIPEGFKSAKTPSSQSSSLSSISSRSSSGIVSLDRKNQVDNSFVDELGRIHIDNNANPDKGVRANSNKGPFFL